MTLAVAFTIDKQVGFEQVSETQIQMNPKQAEQLADLTPEARADRMRIVVLSYRYGTYASPMFLLALSAFAALVLWVSFNFGLGARTTYGQMLCLWMYCWLPHLLSGLVTIVRLTLGGGAENFDLKMPVGTNLGYYFADAPAWLRSLFGFVDIIGIWGLVLLVIGGAIVAKVKVGQAAAVVIGWWLLIVLVSTAATAAFS
jgi:hypothetical protein